MVLKWLLVLKWLKKKYKQRDFFSFIIILGQADRIDGDFWKLPTPNPAIAPHTPSFQKNNVTPQTVEILQTKSNKGCYGIVE